MQPDPAMQEAIARQAALFSHLNFMTFVMFYLALPVMAFFGSLIEGFNQKMNELKQEAIQKRKKNVHGYDGLPAVERKAQEDLWQSEIDRELLKDGQAIWKSVKHSLMFSTAIAIIVFILEIIFYKVILRFIF